MNIPIPFPMPRPCFPIPNTRNPVLVMIRTGNARRKYPRKVPLQPFIPVIFKKRHWPNGKNTVIDSILYILFVRYVLLRIFRYARVFELSVFICYFGMDLIVEHFNIMPSPGLGITRIRIDFTFAHCNITVT